MTPPPGERGSALVLGIGLVAACLLAAVVLVDATAAFLQRQQLFAVADGAALAGAQAIDLTAYYAHGASPSTRLEPSGVSPRVRAHLRSSRAVQIVEGLAIDRITSDGVTVVVALSAPLRLPFLTGLVEDRVRVESVAQLAYRG